MIQVMQYSHDRNGAIQPKLFPKSVHAVDIYISFMENNYKGNPWIMIVKTNEGASKLFVGIYENYFVVLSDLIVSMTSLHNFSFVGNPQTVKIQNIDTHSEIPCFYTTTTDEGPATCAEPLKLRYSFKQSLDFITKEIDDLIIQEVLE